jgi:hypothetical protein
MSHRQRLLGTLWRYTGHPEHDSVVWVQGDIVFVSEDDIVLIVDVKTFGDRHTIKSIHGNRCVTNTTLDRFLMTHTQIK